MYLPLHVIYRATSAPSRDHDRRPESGRCGEKPDPSGQPHRGRPFRKPRVNDSMAEEDEPPPALHRPTEGGPSMGSPPGHLSLEGMHGSVAVPSHQAGFWRQWRAFVGPAILISVGYMDPGNWGTDLAGGAQFKYGLLWVVALASFMAVILQVLSARLGVATGKDLAQCCRDWYPSWTRWPNWIAMEIAIGATDLAESLGSAVALNLLFHIPLQWAIIITAFDVLLLLGLQGLGMRMIEAVVSVFVLTIGVCYGIEIFGLSQTQPSFPRSGYVVFSCEESFSLRHLDLPSPQSPIYFF